MSTDTERRITDGLRWLTGELVATREEAHRHLGPMLADGLLSRGYATRGDDGRMAVSAAGRRRLAAVEPEDTDGAA